MSSINSVVSSLLNDYYGIAKTTVTTTKDDKDTTETTGTTATKTPDDSAESSNVSYTRKTSLGRYMLSLDSSDDANAKTVFEKLSIDLGGGGKTITKNQLDSYIEDAQKGTISIPDEEMDSLLDLQKNWDTVADGADSINYSSISAARYDDTLLSMVPADEDNSEITSLIEAGNKSTIDAYSYIMNSALGFSASTDDDSGSSLVSMLNSLLSGTTDEDDDKNANLIATITNLISNSKSSSTIELEA